YNIIYVVVNRLSKRVILIPYYKTIIARDINKIFYKRVLLIFRLFKIIIFNYGP
ncbi:uncharacterized protein BDZ83DRAFT_593379, partial [Colletotrichum acutatum]